MISMTKTVTMMVTRIAPDIRIIEFPDRDDEAPARCRPRRQSPSPRLRALISKHDKAQLAYPPSPAARPQTACRRPVRAGRVRPRPVSCRRSQRLREQLSGARRRWSGSRSPAPAIGPRPNAMTKIGANARCRERYGQIQEAADDGSAATAPVRYSGSKKFGAKRERHRSGSRHNFDQNGRRAATNSFCQPQNHSSILVRPGRHLPGIRRCGQMADEVAK